MTVPGRFRSVSGTSPVEAALGQNVRDVNTVEVSNMLYQLASHAGTLEILVYLNKKGTASMGEMGRTLRPCSETLGRSIRCLVQSGLVEAQPASNFPFTRRFNLTPAGRFLVTVPLSQWPDVLRFG